jgi:hypothetical protein
VLGVVGEKVGGQDLHEFEELREGIGLDDETGEIAGLYPDPRLGPPVGLP